MRSTESAIVLSASDLTGHLNCRHLTALDVEVARGTRAKPKVWDPVLELLAERGALHEASYLDHLRAGGLNVLQVDGIRHRFEFGLPDPGRDAVRNGHHRPRRLAGGPDGADELTF